MDLKGSRSSHPQHAGPQPAPPSSNAAREELLAAVSDTRELQRVTKRRTELSAIGGAAMVAVAGIGGLWMVAGQDRGDGSAATAIYASFWMLYLTVLWVIGVVTRALVIAVSARSRLRARVLVATADSRLRSHDAEQAYQPDRARIHALSRELPTPE